MKMTNAILCICLCCAISLSATGQNASSEMAVSPAPRAQGGPPCDAASSNANDEIRSDLKKMRSLIAQMQRNLAAVSTGEMPLKHQFQLEIDMWLLIVKHLESRMEANGR